MAVSEELHGFAGMHISSDLMRPISTMVLGAAGLLVIGVPPHVPVCSQEVQDFQGHSITVKGSLFALRLENLDG